MLTNRHFGNHYRATNAITNVLKGRTADGTRTIPYKISFTDDEPARKAAAHQLRLIFCHCHSVLDPDDITPLTVKLLWHLTRTAKQTSAEIFSIPIILIIHAIRHAPHMVRGKGSLFAIVRRYQQHKAQERARRWFELRDTVPARTLLWTNGVFTLEEANDPRHLLYDSLFLGHCVGTLYNADALAHRKLTHDHPDAIHYLHYWMKVRDGLSRIITLIEADTPRVTIDFHPHTQTIIAVQGKITPLGQLLPLPASVKEPLFAAIKVLPIAKKGGRQLQTLVFEPNQPKQKVRRITRFTAV